MLGIAILTIVRSSKVMKKPSETTMSTTHGFVPRLARAAAVATISSPAYDLMCTYATAAV
jgi:hypothetical protein